MQEHPPALTSKGDISMTMYKTLTKDQKAKAVKRSQKHYQKNMQDTLWAEAKRERERLYYQKTKELRRERNIASYEKRRLENPVPFAYRGCRQGARQRGIEFNITVEYLQSIWNEVCPILGISMTTNKGRVQDNSYSIDRIDSSKGYVEGNVMVISYRANVIKNMGTAEEHQKIANYLMLLEAAKTDSQLA